MAAERVAMLIVTIPADDMEHDHMFLSVNAAYVRTKFIEHELQFIEII